jgi:hypothetical protein
MAGRALVLPEDVDPVVGRSAAQQDIALEPHGRDLVRGGQPAHQFFGQFLITAPLGKARGVHADDVTRHPR